MLLVGLDIARSPSRAWQEKNSFPDFPMVQYDRRLEQGENPWPNENQTNLRGN
jgi:hypothetical protein